MNVSILIATYGPPSWERLALTRALPSVKDFPCEVLVGHDPEGTIASVRNGLAERATSEWLCFLDADDELAPGYLDAMQRALSEEGEGLEAVPPLLTPAVRQLRRGTPRGPFFYPEVDLRGGNWLVIGTLVHHDLFEKVGGFENYPHGLEDWQMWAKCFKAGARVVKVADAVYVQHYNPRSKHWRLARNRTEYQRHYEAARASVWG
jgi:GT2 family glycosyltransferase